MTSVVRFEEWQEPTGTTAATVDSSGNVSLSGNLSVSGSVTSTGNPQGLTLLRTVSIGSAVSIVDVTSVFSSAYNSYLVRYNIDSATLETQFSCQLLSGTTVTSSGYEMQLVYLHFASQGVQVAASTSLNRFPWLGGMKGGSGSAWHSGAGAFQLHNPYLSNYYTFCESGSYGATTTGGHSSGIHQTQASYDGFRFYTDIGTISGGTIRVYGYGQ